MSDDPAHWRWGGYGRAVALGDAGAGRGADVAHAAGNYTAYWAFPAPPHSAGHCVPAGGFVSTCRRDCV